MEEAQGSAGRRRKILLVLYCLMLAVGGCGGPLIMRLYFVRGGKRIWLSSWLETGGWFILLIPLVAAYLHRRSSTTNSNGGRGSNTKIKMVLMKPRVFIASAIIGVMTGLDDYLYAYGVARLPLSTSALIISTQLAFCAGFAFLLVKQKFTSYSVNAVVLLTVGAAVLALHTSSDRAKGESNKEYVLGFVMTLAAAALYGLILPMVELMYLKGKQVITYTLVLEIQTVMSFFATAFCTVGMLINNDFKAIPKEAREFGLGEAKYYVVIACSGIIWQFFFLGATGVIFCSSSLLSGIIITVLIPVTEVLAVIFYQESFKAEKGVALFLSLWGFVSNFYGEIKHQKKESKAAAHLSDQQLAEMKNSTTTASTA